MPGQAWTTRTGEAVLVDVKVTSVGAGGNVAVPQDWQGARVLCVAGAPWWRLEESAGILRLSWQDGLVGEFVPVARSVKVSRGHAGATAIVALLEEPVDATPTGAT